MPRWLRQRAWLAPLPFILACGSSGGSPEPAGDVQQVDGGASTHDDAAASPHPIASNPDVDSSVGGGRSDAAGAVADASGGGAAHSDGGPRSRGGAADSGGAGDSGTAADSAAGDTTATADAAPASNHTGPWQIMPLGDSITGTTCYPQLLSQELIAQGHTSFAFIGTNDNDQSCNKAAPVQTEGHGGYLVTYVTQSNPPKSPTSQSDVGKLSELQSWAAEKPDVVLMHFGTNDAWNGISASDVLSSYTIVLQQFRDQNPSVIFFVAQILPLNPSGCSTCESNVEALNKQIPGWASSQTTTASPIYVVDVWSAEVKAVGGSAASYAPNSSYTSDGVHPTLTGAQPVADAWATALAAQSIP